MADDRVSRELSLYLDAMRFLAALAVFFGHLSGQRLTGGLFWQAGPYAPEAVAMFFVLSGFVIGYVTEMRERSVASYAIARAARIYSVALPALVLTFALDALGSAARPDLYSAAWGYEGSGRALQFLASLLFINHLWFLDIAPGSDLSYWSLGYEVPYYAVFGIAVFAPRRWRAIGVVAALAVVGPQVAGLFLLWLTGFAAYHLCARGKLPETPGAMLCAGAAMSWVGYEAWAWQGHRLAAWGPSSLVNPDLPQDYLVGTLFAAHLVGFSAVSARLAPLFARCAAGIRWTAGATFSLYLFHLPIAQFLATQVPWPPSALPTRVVIVGGTLALVFALAELTERRKALWRQGFAIMSRAVPP